MRIDSTQLRKIIREEVIKEMRYGLPTEDMFKGDLIKTNKVITYVHDVETGDTILEIRGAATGVFLGYLKPKGLTWHQQMYEKSIVLMNGVRGWVWSDDISLVD